MSKSENQYFCDLFIGYYIQLPYVQFNSFIGYRIKFLNTNANSILRTIIKQSLETGRKMFVKTLNIKLRRVYDNAFTILNSLHFHNPNVKTVQIDKCSAINRCLKLSFIYLKYLVIIYFCRTVQRYFKYVRKCI